MKLSIDLGGTNIRIAQVEQGKCLNKESVPCPAQQDAAAVLSLLSRLVRDMMDGRVDGIGIGVPSIVDSVKGIVYNVANIASWKEIHLKEVLENEFGLPVAVNNDSNCFALGENLYGVGKPYDNMVGITIGTGIGAGVVIGRRLYGGQYLGAGEIGSLPYLDSDFEHYCSSFFFRRYNTTGAAEAEKARQGDPAALGLWNGLGMHLGNLMKAVLFTYAPQAIVLGGGIAAAFPFFKDAMEQAMQSFPYKVISDKVKVEVSQQTDSSLLGASALWEK